MISDADREAARQYLELDHARHSLAGEPAELADQQAKAIAAKHENAQKMALVGTADELGEIPKHLKAHQARIRKNAGIDSAQAARIRSTYRGEPAPRPRATPKTPSTPAPRSSSPAPRPARTPAAPHGRARSSGFSVPSIPDGGAGATLLTAFGWGIGLSILYVALTHAERLSTITNGAMRATRAIVAVNVDPLNPHGPAGHPQKRKAHA